MLINQYPLNPYNLENLFLPTKMILLKRDFLKMKWTDMKLESFGKDGLSDCCDYYVYDFFFFNCYLAVPWVNFGSFLRRQPHEP